MATSNKSYQNLKLNERHFLIRVIERKNERTPTLTGAQCCVGNGIATSGTWTQGSHTALSRKVDQAEGQQRGVEVHARRNAARVPGTLDQLLGQVAPISAHLLLGPPEGGLGVAQHAHADPLQEPEGEHAMGHLVAGLGQVHWDVLAGGRGEGGDEVGKEADLKGREGPPE